MIRSDPTAIRKEIEDELHTGDGFSILVDLDFGIEPLKELLKEICNSVTGCDRIWVFRERYDSDEKMRTFRVEIDSE